MCSLFGINFRKIFQKRANLLNQFYLDELSAELIQNHKITTVSGIIYQVSLAPVKPEYVHDMDENLGHIFVRCPCERADGWTVESLGYSL